jgi:hypothetical protein
MPLGGLKREILMGGAVEADRLAGPFGPARDVFPQAVMPSCCRMVPMSK